VAEVPHDPAVTLRLELGRVTDQRDAYAAALRKEVLVVIKDALADNSRLIAENNYLKAEVERLKNNCAYLDKKLDEELDK
jgi:cell division protein FtsB